MSVEEWRSIPEYEGLYEVSNHGNVRSLHKEPRVLKPYKNSRYAQVALCKNGIVKLKLVHRLVSQCFVAGYSESKETDHINGDKWDNRPENIRNVSKSQNNRAHRTKSKGKTSRFRGVHWERFKKVWKATIQPRGKYIVVGYFKQEEEAARAYNQKAQELGYAKEALNHV